MQACIAYIMSKLTKCGNVTHSHQNIDKTWPYLSITSLLAYSGGMGEVTSSYVPKSLLAGYFMYM